LPLTPPDQHPGTDALRSIWYGAICNRCLSTIVRHCRFQHLPNSASRLVCAYLYVLVGHVSHPRRDWTLSEWMVGPRNLRTEFFASFSGIDDTTAPSWVKRGLVLDCDVTTVAFKSQYSNSPSVLDLGVRAAEPGVEGQRCLCA